MIPKSNISWNEIHLLTYMNLDNTMQSPCGLFPYSYSQFKRKLWEQGKLHTTRVDISYYDKNMPDVEKWLVGFQKASLVYEAKRGRGRRQQLCVKGSLPSAVVPNLIKTLSIYVNSNGSQVTPVRLRIVVETKQCTIYYICKNRILQVFREGLFMWIESPLISSPIARLGGSLWKSCAPYPSCLDCNRKFHSWALSLPFSSSVCL